MVVLGCSWTKEYLTVAIFLQRWCTRHFCLLEHGFGDCGCLLKSQHHRHLTRINFLCGFPRYTFSDKNEYLVPVTVLNGTKKSSQCWAPVVGACACMGCILEWLLQVIMLPLLHLPPSTSSSPFPCRTPTLVLHSPVIPKDNCFETIQAVMKLVKGAVTLFCQCRHAAQGYVQLLVPLSRLGLI